MKLLTLVNTSPCSFIESLTKEQLDSLTVLNHNKILTKVCREKILLIFSMHDFIRNLKLLNIKYTNKYVVLFCSTLDAVKYKLETADAKKLDYLTFESVQLNYSFETLPDIKVKRKVPDHLENLIAIYNDSSVLTPLMTLLYTHKGAARLLLQSIIFKWLFSIRAKSTDILVKQLVNQSQVKITKRFLSRLLEILNSDLGKSLCKATIKISKLPKSKRRSSYFALYAKQYGIDSYELSYLCTSFYELRTKHSLTNIYFNKGSAKKEA